MSQISWQRQSLGLTIERGEVVVRSLTSAQSTCSACLAAIACAMSATLPAVMLQTPDEAIRSRAASWVGPSIAMALAEEDFEQTVVDQRQTPAVQLRALELPPRFKLTARKVHSELVFARSADDQRWHVGRRILSDDGQSSPRQEPTPEVIVSRGLRAAMPEIDALQGIISLFYAGSSEPKFDYPTWPFVVLEAQSRPRFLFTSSARRVGFDEQNSDALNGAHGVLSLDKDGRVTGAELRIHFPGAAERLTVEFTVDARSHIVRPAKMSERYQHAIQDVTAVAVYSHFRWFDADGRLIAPS
jgi:hypothetical protein